MKQKGFF